MEKAREILDFWFEETEPRFWWKKDTQFDCLIATRFAHVHAAATRGECFDWRYEPRGRLAEVLVLDQFSRNLFRDQSRAFAVDSMALALAQEAVRLKADQVLSVPEKSFLYMPYMHSESRRIHREAVKLFSAAGLEDSLKFELRHKAIIDEFGRYPHRNEILQRTSTEAEIEFLKQPGSRF